MGKTGRATSAPGFGTGHLALEMTTRGLAEAQGAGSLEHRAQHDVPLLCPAGRSLALS